MIRVANALNALSDPRVPNSSFDVMLSLLISLHVVDGVVVSGTVAEFPEDGVEDELTTAPNELTPPRIYPTLVATRSPSPMRCKHSPSRVLSAPAPPSSIR